MPLLWVSGDCLSWSRVSDLSTRGQVPLSTMVNQEEFGVMYIVFSTCKTACASAILKSVVFVCCCELQFCDCGSWAVPKLFLFQLSCLLLSTLPPFRKVTVAPKEASGFGLEIFGSAPSTVGQVTPGKSLLVKLQERYRGAVLRAPKLVQDRPCWSEVSCQQSHTSVLNSKIISQIFEQ